LSEFQRRLYAKSKENCKNGLDASELQQQVSDLRNSLAEVIRQNQDLETALTQKQLELEQRDRVMREQSKFLKVRNELLSLLKQKQQDNADNHVNENYEDDEVTSASGKSSRFQSFIETDTQYSANSTHRSGARSLKLDHAILFTDQQADRGKDGSDPRTVRYAGEQTDAGDAVGEAGEAAGRSAGSGTGAAHAARTSYRPTGDEPAGEEQEQ